MIQFPRMLLTIQVDIPALDRLVSYLEGLQQQQVDELVARLSKQSAVLSETVEKNKGD